MGIYAIRTTANKERNVASKLADRVEKDKISISAIVVPGLKGYLLVEGDKNDIEKAYKGVSHARGLVEGETNLTEIEHFLLPKAAVTNLQEGFIVEVTSTINPSCKFVTAAFGSKKGSNSVRFVSPSTKPRACETPLYAFSMSFLSPSTSKYTSNPGTTIAEILILSFSTLSASFDATFLSLFAVVRIA